MKEKLFLAFLLLIGIASMNHKAMGVNPVDFLPATSATEAELKAGGTFYVVNMHTGKLLTRTLTTDYGTRACVADYVDPEQSRDLYGFSDSYRFTIAYNEANDYYTFYSEGTNLSGEVKNGFMDSNSSNNVWVDRATANADDAKWEISFAAQDGLFSIKNRLRGAEGEFLAPRATGNYSLCYTNTSAIEYADFVDWKFYSSESFDFCVAKSRLYEWTSAASELLAEQSTTALQTAYENALDVRNNGTTVTELNLALNSLKRAISGHLIATGKYIYNPSFDTGTLGWTCTKPYGYGYTAVEIFRKGVSDFSQTIFDLPKGLYKLTAQAFYRNDGGSNAYMYAGSTEKQLNVRTGNEGNMQTAATSFSAGIYPMEIVFSHYETGDLTLGIKNTDALNTWIIFDRFNLVKLGDDPVVASQDLIDELTRLIAEAEILCAGNVQLMGDINEEKNKAAAYEALVTNSSEVEASVQAVKFVIATVRGNYVTNTKLTGAFAEVHSGTHVANADEKETMILPAGKYTLVGNAFHRRYQQGNTQAGIDRYKNRTEEIAAYLYMTPSGETSVIQPVKSIYSKEADLISFGSGKNGYPDNIADGTAAFNAGHYLNILNFELTEKTEITVGIKITSGNWNGFGRFKLFKSEEMDLSLSDKEQYVAPVLGAVMKEIKYVRNFPDKKVNPSTGNGWQSLCLPFHVTSIKLGETELIPGVNCWLFEAQNGNYIPATEIEAYKYYLMSLPNDPAYYVEELCLHGDVTFTGTDLAAKAALPEVAVSGEYAVTASYEGAYTNAVMGGNSYGILDVAETTYFVKGQYNGTFWAHAKATAGEGAFESFNIFGDLTSIRPITGDRSGSKDVTVAGVEGGIELNAATSQFVRIYSFGGQFVKAMQVPSGTIRIELPAGEYIVSGQKVIVTF